MTSTTSNRSGPGHGVYEKWRDYRRPGYYEELDYAWTMTIDLDRCMGCEACVTACKAENNLPIVGEKAFAQGREVQWMRVERYWEGTYPNAKLRFIPDSSRLAEGEPRSGGGSTWSRYLSSWGRGRSRWKSLPCSGVLSTETRPPCRSARVSCARRKYIQIYAYCRPLVLIPESALIPDS